MRFIALLLLALASFGAAAQDVPGRVGRVSFTEGSVAIYQDPDIGWETAYVNSPVTSENSLWTEPGARAEFRVSAVALRLDEATQLDISRLDDDEMVASIVRGSVQLRIRHNDYNSRFSFDTPEARFTITREGSYRIDVDSDRQETRLAVFTGEATIETAQGARAVPAGRMVRISNGDFRFERASTNAFDRWAQTRDRDWVESKAPQYVSTFMTGYEELDPYGQWIQEPEYGALWMPTHVAADWVPYRYGHWSYVRPWGWTWIDDQRWGYAPFHYGRWVHVRNRWCWYPGERIARPAWAPALVAWVGGSNWNVGVSSGSPVMGWYPLAPHEAYRPWYRANDAYLSRVNHNADRDRRRDDRGRDDRRRDAHEWNRERGITAVPRENLIARRPVQQSMVRIAADAARNAPAVQPQAVIPNTNELQRIRTERSRTAPASLRSQRPAGASMPAAAPSAPGQPAAAQQRGNAPIARGERSDRDRGNRGQGNQAVPAQPSFPITAPQIAPGAPVAPVARPNFSRNQAPAPAPSPAAAPQAQPAAAPQGNPLSRGNAERGNAERGNSDRGRERAQQQQQQQDAQRQRQQDAQRQQQQDAQRQQQQQQQQHQQQQQEAQRQREQQQEVQRRASDAQQRAQQQEAQRRANEAQRAQQQQQQQQEVQRRAAEAQQRAQQQEAQRRANEAQRAQQQQQQQQEVQRRAAEAQQRAQQQAQEAQRRAAEAQQRAQQQQQQQRPQPAQRPAQEQRPAPQAAQPAPQGNPAQRGGDEHRGRDKERPDNDDKPGKGR